MPADVADKPEPSKKPEKELPPEPDRFLTREEELLAWRFCGLLDLGFAPQQAELLIHRPDVAHDAADLIALGMPHDLVLNELV